MPSELKSATSRANGAKSHGPKTPEGKEASSRNSLKHGLTSRSTILLQCESLDEFKEFLAEHIAIHQPVTRPEEELVDQMAIARWRIRRFVAAETVLFDCEMVRNQDAVNKEFATTDADVHIAMAIRSLADESRTLSLMSRYESRHQRVHDKAYAALRELQQFRASHPTPPEPDPPPATSPDPAPALDSDTAPSPTATSPTHPPVTPTAPSVSAGESSTHNPSVSAGDTPIHHKISRNEPDIHLCPPLPAAESVNSEDHDG